MSVPGYPDEIIFTGQASLYRRAVRSQRSRPAFGGMSVGPIDGRWAGTLASVVYDTLTHTRLFLSNWHVLAYGNLEPPGLTIMQPGIADCPISGDHDHESDDIFGELWRYAKVLRPEEGSNTVDAAVGIPYRQADLSDEILDIGRPDHFRDAVIGEEVVMSGRDGFMVGRVKSTNAATAVSQYPWGAALFRDQIKIEPGIPHGDSGMLVVAMSDKAVLGLAFAGSDEFTLANKASNVSRILQVDWA